MIALRKTVSARAQEAFSIVTMMRQSIVTMRPLQTTCIHCTNIGTRSNNLYEARRNWKSVKDFAADRSSEK
jgi:hypothetical protein